MSLKDLIADVNINEIYEHIETETLSEWVNAWQKAALTALRPVSREQVERVWRGCPHCLNSSARQNLGYQYCEHCGRPLTDKAVDIRLKELEALKDGPEQ